MNTLTKATLWITFGVSFTLICFGYCVFATFQAFAEIATFYG
jgi:hypothetical protein